MSNRWAPHSTALTVICPAPKLTLRIRQENTGHHDFAALVWELIDSTRPYMWYDQNAWPTLGQVRGRCVMFCRFGFESGRESALWSLSFFASSGLCSVSPSGEAS